jgi:hypothetical protein
MLRILMKMSFIRYEAISRDILYGSHDLPKSLRIIIIWQASLPVRWRTVIG